MRTDFRNGEGNGNSLQYLNSTHHNNQQRALLSNGALNDPLYRVGAYVGNWSHPRGWHIVPVSPFQYNMGDEAVDVNALTTVLQNGGDIN